MRRHRLEPGFEDSQIRSLLDDQATSRNVIKEMSTWLRKGVNAEDRVVFYYSSHGSNSNSILIAAIKVVSMRGNGPACRSATGN